MPDLLLDSCILIDVMRNEPRATAYIRRVANAGAGVIHAISVAELAQGAHNASEQRAILRFLRGFTWVHTSEADSTAALANFLSLHLAQDIDYPDCLIAVAALRLDLSVATINDRHFRLFKRLKVIRPY